MKIIYASGDNPRGVSCLDHIIKNDYRPVAIISDKSNSLEKLAQEHSVDLLKFKNINSKRSLSRLRSYNPDLIILCTYNHIIKKSLLELPKRGVINLHGGKLPEYRGSSVINWAIINDKKEITASIFYVDEGIDTGDIIAEQMFTILYEDTIKEVIDKTLEIFPPLLLGALKQIESGTETRKPQIGKGKYWKKRKPKGGKIKWDSMDSRQIYNFVRALMHPYPGAFTTYNGKKLFVWKVSELESKLSNKPGQIISTNLKGAVTSTKGKDILIEQVQFENGPKILAYSLDIAKFLE